MRNPTQEEEGFAETRGSFYSIDTALGRRLRCNLRIWRKHVACNQLSPGNGSDFYNRQIIHACSSGMKLSTYIIFFQKRWGGNLPEYLISHQSCYLDCSPHLSWTGWKAIWSLRSEVQQKRNGVGSVTRNLSPGFDNTVNSRTLTLFWFSSIHYKPTRSDLWTQGGDLGYWW